MTIRSVMQSAIRALWCSALVVIAQPALAQDRMDKPVHILVGFAAGGTADLIARIVADKLKDTIGQPVIVDNRPGAAGRIAADAVKGAPPDGATIMVMPIGPMAVVPHTLKSISYDTLKDFTPIGLGATFQFALAVGPQSGAKTWNEYVAWVKANPAKASYATSAAGSRPRSPRSAHSPSGMSASKAARFPLTSSVDRAPINTVVTAGCACGNRSAAAGRVTPCSVQTCRIACARWINSAGAWL